jgi:hypothetical protein
MYKAFNWIDNGGECVGFELDILCRKYDEPREKAAI